MILDTITAAHKVRKGYKVYYSRLRKFVHKGTTELFLIIMRVDIFSKFTLRSACVTLRKVTRMINEKKYVTNSVGLS